MTTKKMQKNAKKYECILCAFNTSNKANYNTHITTQKHKKLINTTPTLIKMGKNAEIFSCTCGKAYPYRASLYNHKKKCFIQDLTINNGSDNNEELKVDYTIVINSLLQQNKELQTTIKELIPKIGNNNTSNNINQNINIFLNEQCKDAMTLTDFISTIQVSIADLLFTKEKGLTQGITNLFLSNLEKLPLIQRPLWCSDKKRKRMFIKQDKWVEDKEREKTHEAIYTISKIQTRNITKYIADKPNWMMNDKIKDNYMHIVKTVTDTMENKTEKIVENIVDRIHLTEDAKDKILQ